MDAMLNALRNPTARDRSILLGQAGASHFGMALSLATGLIYLLVQYDGFVFTWLVLAVLAIQATLLYGPNLLVGLWRTPNIPLSKIMGGTTFLFIYFIAAAAYFPLALIPFFAIGLAGLLYSVSAARPRNFGAGVWIMLLFVGLLYALYTFGIYENQALFFRLSLVGDALGDTLFHAAIGNLFIDYGVITTGADGLVPFGYYTIMNSFNAAVGRVLGISAPQAFSLAMGIIVVPSMFATAMRVVLYFGRLRRTIAYVLGVLLFTFAVFCFASADYSQYIWSESLAFGNIFFVAAVGILMEFWALRIRLAGTAAAIFIAAMVLLLAITAFTKISTGLVLAMLMAYAFVRGYFIGILAKIVAVAAVSGFILYAFVAFVPVGQSQLFQGVPYLIAYLNRGQFLFLLTHFAFSWILVYYILSQGHIRRSNLWRHIRQGRTLPAEFALLLTLTTIPVLFISPGNPVFYFTNMQMWFSLPLLIGLMLRSHAVAGLTWPAFRGALMTTRNAVPVALALIACIPLSDKFQEVILGGTYKLVSKAISERAIVHGVDVPPAVRSLFAQQLVADLSPKRETFETNRNLIEKLNAVRRQHGKGLVAYVPKSITSFWTLYGESCGAQAESAHFIPAYTGIPMIFGTLQEDCGRTLTSHAWNYYEMIAPKTGSDTELCERTRAKGFRSVARVDFDGEWKIRVIQCGPADGA